MKKKRNKILVLGSLVAVSSGCETAKQATSPSVVSDGSTIIIDKQQIEDSLSLVERLKELTAVQYDTQMLMSAMCYAMAAPIEEDYVCVKCESKTPSTTYKNANIRNIRKKIEQMQMMGYDVRLNESQYCDKCSGKKIKNPELIFEIRFSKNTPYHSAASNIASEYDAVLQFFTSKEAFIEFVENNKQKAESTMLVIKKMTGLDM